MATNLRSAIDMQLSWTWRDQEGLSTIVDSNRLHFLQNLTDGSGANEADGVWHTEDLVLTADTSMVLELDALEKDLFGDTISIAFLLVKGITIVNKTSGGSGHLLVGGAADSPWYEPFGSAADKVKVMPGGALFLASPASGWNVGTGATKLQIAAVGAEVTFDVAILGAVTSS